MGARALHTHEYDVCSRSPKWRSPGGSVTGSSHVIRHALHGRDDLARPLGPPRTRRSPDRLDHQQRRAAGRVREHLCLHVGAGIRGAKLQAPGSVLASLSRATVIEGLGR